MISIGSRRIHLALTDSRGYEVHEHIVRMNNSRDYFDLQPCDEVTLGQLIETAEGYLKGTEFDVVYITGGVNDITTKVPYTKMISFTWRHVDDLKSHLTGILQRADKALSQTFPASRGGLLPSNWVRALQGS